jgi:hypothetical protein
MNKYFKFKVNVNWTSDDQTVIIVESDSLDNAYKALRKHDADEILELINQYFSGYDAEVDIWDGKDVTEDILAGDESFDGEPFVNIVGDFDDLNLQDILEQYANREKTEKELYFEKYGYNPNQLDLFDEKEC